jgi:4-amino-4-deoxy-L-arabinose transferase-like glycosyltransferase
MLTRRSSTASRRQLLALFAIAFACKLGFLIATHDNAFVLGLSSDEAFHVAEAQLILRDGLLRDDAFYFAPLYPYLLAGLFGIVGVKVWAILGLHTVLGAINTIVVFQLARKIFGSNRVAWISATLTLSFGPYYMYEALVLKATLAVLVTNLSLLLLFTALERDASILWLGCGLSFGLLTLLRGNTLLILPFVFFGLALEHRRQRVTPARMALWLTGVAVGILPATVHNAIAAEDFVPTTYQGGTNFFIGNHQGASGTYHSLRPGRGRPSQERYDAVTVAEEASGRPLWPSEVSNFWLGRGIEDIVDDPAAWLRLMAKKCYLFHGNAEIMDTVDYRVFRELSPVLWLAPISFGMLVGFAIPGLYLARRLPNTRLLALVLLGSAASVIVFFVFGRYRLPVTSLYALFAAHSIDRVIEFGGAQRWRPVAATVLIALASFALLLVPTYEADPVMARSTLAEMYEQLGDLPNARLSLERAVARLPDHPELRQNLAAIMMKQGEFCAAVEQHRFAAAQHERRAWADTDPIVRLQGYERLTARVKALSHCPGFDDELEHVTRERRRLARALLDDARAGALRPAPSLLEELTRAASTKTSTTEATTRSPP